MQTERIVGIRYIGKNKTIDIEVNSKDHIFYANGIATSNSHAVGYSEISYWTAYVKAHFPIHFYCAWLEMSSEKGGKGGPQEEVEELVEDAKLFNIGIYPPKIPNVNFSLGKNGVYFGLRHIKNIGDSSVVKLLNAIIETQSKLGKNINDWTWFELLAFLSENISKTVFNNLISIGVLSPEGMTRQKMLHEHNMWKKLKEKEKTLIISSSTNLLDGLEQVLGSAKESRKETIRGIIETLENPPYEIEDTPQWVTSVEEELLGVAITCNKLDNVNSSAANTTCKEFIEGKSEKEMTFGVEISRSTEYIIKNGKNIGKPMGFLTLKDNTGSIDASIFTDLWLKIKNLTYKGNTCLITGYRSKKGGLVVQRIKEI